ARGRERARARLDVHHAAPGERLRASGPAALSRGGGRLDAARPLLYRNGAAETTARLREMRARETAAVPDLADLAAQVDRLAREAALLDTTEPTTQALDDLAQRLATLRDA